MANLVALTSMLEKSINTPLLNADPAYIAIKADLANIVEYYAGKSSDEEVILLYAKKEVYLRLATAVAPNYDLEAQFTRLTKSVRFDHYFKLVGYVQNEIDNHAYEIQYSDVVKADRDGTARNYLLDNLQTATLTASNITASTIDLDWTVFDTSKSRFCSYFVYVSKTPVYDPYEENELSITNVEKSYHIIDMFKNKLRIKELSPLTKYYIVVAYNAMSGRKTIVTTEATTI